ncbi:MAG: hypothetical protein WCK00_17030 [Deltaproteobacteria bacterium]
MSESGSLARNLDVAKIIGLNAGLCAIVERLKKRKDCPLWLIGKLVDSIYVSNCLITPLVQHRDELLEADIQEMELYRKRYEALRVMTPIAFTELWMTNLQDGTPFDELVDEMVTEMGFKE